MSLDLNAVYWASSGQASPPSSVLVECLSKCGPTSIPPDPARPCLVQTDLEVVQLRDHPHCNAAPGRLMRGCMCYSLHCSLRLSEPQTRPDRKCSQVAIAIARGLVTCVCSSRVTLPNASQPFFCTIYALRPNLHHEFNQPIDYNPPRPLVACPLTRPSSRACSHQELVKNSIKAHLSHCATSSHTIKASHPKKTPSFLPLLLLTPQRLSKAPTLPLLLTNSTLSTSPAA
jgi:hypothetical protein